MGSSSDETNILNYWTVTLDIDPYLHVRPVIAVWVKYMPEAQFDFCMQLPQIDL